MKKDRLEKILSSMKEKNIPQIIISDSIVIYYLTGSKIDCGERMIALVLREDGNHTMVMNDLYSVREGFDMNIQFYNDTEDGVKIVNRFLDQGKTVGIDKNWSSSFLLRLMELNPKSRYVSSSVVIDYVRQVKTAEEQELMIKSSLINDRVVERLIERIPEDYDELELYDICCSIYEEEGCEGTSFPPITAFAGNAADPHHSSDHTKGKYGDCLVIDIGGFKDGYASDLTRTVFLGEVSERQKEIYDIVLEANLRGIAAAKVGNRMCDVDNAARSYIEEKGYGKYFIHRTGHSIGLEDHEFGDVSASNGDLIKAGQCFSVEPGIYLPDENIGVRIEDLVLTSQEGPIVLNHFTKDLIVVPFEKK